MSEELASGRRISRLLEDQGCSTGGEGKGYENLQRDADTVLGSEELTSGRSISRLLEEVRAVVPQGRGMDKKFTATR